MLPHFGNPDLSLVTGFIESLSVRERKALITIARAQVLPIRTDTILIDKTRPILDKLVTDPPYLDYRFETLTRAGAVLYGMITAPYLTGLVVSLCLGASIDQKTSEDLHAASFDKEFLATQTPRKDQSWDWTLLNAEWGEPYRHADISTLPLSSEPFHSAFRHQRYKTSSPRNFRTYP
jgi:hypothetical protein